MSLPEKPWPKISNSGSVRPMTQAMARISTRRGTSAMMMPSRCAVCALLLRQLADEHGDEHQIVDAEDDFERGQRQQAEPDIGIQQPVHRRVVSTFALFGAERRMNEIAF